MAVRVEWQAREGGMWITSSIFETHAEAELNHASRSGVAYRIVPVPDDEDDLIGSNLAGIVRWFGEQWPYPHMPAPICEDFRLRIEVPEHEDCIGCDEPILPTDSGTRMVMVGFPGRSYAYQHTECGLRSVMCPIDLHLVDDPTGEHIHDPAKRREEGRLLLQTSRDRLRP